MKSLPSRKAEPCWHSVPWLEPRTRIVQAGGSLATSTTIFSSLAFTKARYSMPSAWDILKGHQEQRALFARSLARGRLSHAYVLTGVDGIGKRKFARLLAQSMFCRERQPDEIDACGECRACRSFLAGTWPDFMEVGLPAGKTEIPVALISGDNDKKGREGLCFELSMSPQASIDASQSSMTHIA